MRVQKTAVALTNAQQPDLVVITGDFVCHSQLYLDALEEVVVGFDAPVLAVLGNHDHWAGASEVRRALLRAGAEVLENQNIKMTLGGQQLQVVGIDDAYTGHADLAQAVKGLDPHIPVLGLSHIAEMADKMWQFGIPLVLSGHTHGGQITVARFHEMTLGKLAGHRYVHGMYGTRDHPELGAVYVGAGIGASLFPVRLGVEGQREIAIFELGASLGAFPEPLDEQNGLRGRKPSRGKRLKRLLKVERLKLRRARRQKQ